MIDPTMPALAAADDCMRAPVHVTGAIQPHGYLVSCGLSDYRIRHVSGNVESLFGLRPDEVLGLGMSEFLEDDVLMQIRDAVTGAPPGDATAQRVCTVNVGAWMMLCDITAHTADGLLHIEFESQGSGAETRTPASIAQRMVAQLGQDDVGSEFYQRVAEQVHQLTGYDRVMVYRFREDDSGEVVAEVAAEGMEPYLGLRYPASDIPPPARMLYLRNRVRVIPDARYDPVAIIPPTVPSGIPIDLSQHVLRSVSPVHLEYLRNMGVVASMSVSIISGGRLWGLVACHHRQPRRLSASARAAADLFGMFVSMRIAAHEQELAMERFDRAQALREAVVMRLSSANDFDTAVLAELDTLCTVLDCIGAGVLIGDKWHVSGRAPTTGDPTPLLEWASATGHADVAMTDVAAEWVVPALGATGLAGVLGINLGSPRDWVFLFRSEQVEDVRWAGEPHKDQVATDDGTRLAPRRSFAVWQETVHGRSSAWTAGDQRVATRLHRVLREQRSRWRNHTGDGEPEESRFHGQHLQDQKFRLDGMVRLLDGLGHLGDAETAGISLRIEKLEAELQRLIRSTDIVDPSSPRG